MDIFFVPPLNYLSEKLNLSPSVAGVTLMALGNGKYSVLDNFDLSITHDVMNINKHTRKLVLYKYLFLCIY